MTRNEEIKERIQKINYEQKQKYGDSSIKIEATINFNNNVEFGINWGSFGTVSASKAKEYAARLNEAAEIIEKLNNEFNTAL